MGWTGRRGAARRAGRCRWMGAARVRSRWARGRPGRSSCRRRVPGTTASRWRGGAAGLGTHTSTLAATNLLVDAAAGDGAVCDGGDLSLDAFRLERNAGAGVVAHACDATLADGLLVANGGAWITHPGGAVRADDVARQDNEVDTVACTADRDPLPSPPTAPTPPRVEPLEDWPPPPWFDAAGEDEK